MERASRPPSVLDQQESTQLLDREIEARAQCTNRLGQATCGLSSYRHLRQPIRDRDDVRATESLESHRRHGFCGAVDSRLGSQLHVELYPSALR
jgi:hypothetical protein